MFVGAEREGPSGIATCAFTASAAAGLDRGPEACGKTAEQLACATVGNVEESIDLPVDGS
jgi:hypothetical protein